jgi:UPF0176 protein
MSFLHNRVSRRELKQRIQDDPTPRTTFSFYRYVPIADPKSFRDHLYRTFETLGVFGRIYIASEGINAQVSVPSANTGLFRDCLDAQPGLGNLRLNKAVDDDGKSFYALDIKVRPQIVADGITDPGFDMSEKGQYVDAEAFNRMANDPDTILIDMRNHYEYEVGHFRNAIEVPSDTFREQLPLAAAMMEPFKDRNIIMYCTGGIRCEKASAYLLHRGFRNVFHLEGGIIHYVNQARERDLPVLFEGKNFVFDQRMGERITENIIANCHQCGVPADTHVNCVNDACHLLFIQCDRCRESMKGTCSPACRDYLQLSPAEQQKARAASDQGHAVFNKSRRRKKGYSE